MKMGPFIFILSMLTGCIVSHADSLWTREAVVSWYAQHHKQIGFVGYQGSDQTRHHFIARYMDDWVFIVIKKEELRLNDERPFSRAWSAQLYYYLVDPSRYFEVEERSRQWSTCRRLDYTIASTAF